MRDLQVHPELGRGAEPRAEADCRLGGDRTGAIQNPGDSVRRHADVASEAARRQAPFKVERIFESP